MKESFKLKRVEMGTSFLQLQESVSHILPTSAQMMQQVLLDSSEAQVSLVKGLPPSHQ